MRRWLLPVVLATVAAAAAIGAVAYRPSASGPKASLLRGVRTAVLSPRRLPAALSAVSAADHLAARLDPIIGGACMDVQVNGQTIYAHQPQTALLPASNVKLLVAEAALSRLGAESRFTTSAVGARAAVNGVVDGPLWLVGGGDPLLVTAGFRATQTEFTWSTEPGSRLEDLADRIKAAGVRAISGSVVGDDTRYDRQRSVPTWKASYLADGEIGAVGALVVNGGFQSATRHVPAASPAQAAAAALTTLLEQRGVAVGGPPTSGPAPASPVTVAALDSLPLQQIIRVMLLESDNLAAEMLVKELGHRFGTGGSWASGLAVLRRSLAQAGLPVGGLALVDGSGLDRGDRATCDLLIEAVDAPGPVAEMVRSDLPLAGRTGTLVHRMLGRPPAGRLRAKTGSLAGVAALTGLLTAPNGQAGPVFALLANDVASDAAGVALEDRVASALVTYPEAPNPDSLAPS